MFNRRRLSLAVLTVACLVAASGASADPLDTFTAAAAPSQVKPSTSRSYTLTLASNGASPNRAQRAAIGIPAGFTVDASTVQATTTGVAATCDAATWDAVIADQKVQLQRPAADTNALCPGATLTVVFSAVSTATEGTYSWTSELLNDTTGAFTLTGAQPSVVVDGTAPTAAIDGKPGNPSNDKGPSFVFSAAEPSTFECKLDAGELAPCSSPRTYADLADGNHTFAVKATDAVGNVGPEATYTWTIDTAAPAATITQKPNELSNVAAPRFAFTASETGSTFACRLDGGPFESCPSPKSYAAVSDGPHTFEVKATDRAGNTGPADTFAWTIDTVAPTASITATPTNPSRESSPSFAFSASESGSTFMCRLDTQAFASCVSVKSYQALADGTHSFTVRATDTAGNTGPAAIYNWRIDTVAPTATIAQAPSNPSNVAAPRFAFGAGEPSTFACRLDAGAFETCTSPKSYTGLPDGSHTFVVKATDAAGNPGTETSFTWTIDTVAPTVTITEQPSDPTNDTTPTFSFTASDSGSVFNCKLDAAAPEACTSPTTYPALAPGPHVFAVRATDAAGNTSSEARYSWRIDTAAPTVTIGPKPSDPSNVKAPSFSFTASESGSSFSCRLDAGASEACTSPKGYTGLTDGSHTFAVKATDSAGNSSAEASFTWTIDTVASTVTITERPSNPSNVATPTFSFRASESGSSLACKLDTGPVTACTSPLTLPALADGPHQFAVVARDAAGNTGPADTYSWRIDTAAPTATIGQKPSDPSNIKAPSFSFTASEPGSSFWCRLDGGAFEPCTPPKNYPAVADGAHTFAVRAKDPAGNTGPAETYTWTIDTTAPITAITDKPSDPTNDSSGSFSFTASESGSTFACKLDAAEFAPCASPKTYVLADGRHTFSVRATDALGNAGPVATYGWTVDTVAPSAQITQRPAALTNDNTPSFAFTSNEAGATLACRLEQGGFSACTSPTSYGALVDGQHAFAVRATDLAGNTGAATTYTWMIDTVAPTASITGRPSNPSNSRSPSFSFTANEDGSTFACRLDAASFAACTAPIAFSNLVDGPHTVRIRATDQAGNTGPETTYAWTIDTVAPSAAIVQKPDHPTNDTTPTFTFTSEAGATFTCSLDGGAFAGCSSPRTYPHLNDGQHTFAVRATDAAGNTGPSASHAWRIDTGAPSTEIAAVPANPSNVKSATFVFSANDAVATFACKLDGASFAACSSPTTYSNLDEGSHTFIVQATNAAGNTGERKTYTWTVDTVAPAAAIATKPSNPSNSRSPSFAFTAEEPAAFFCKLDAGVFAPCASPHSYGDLPDGTHGFAVIAADAAGNVGPQATYDWVIKTQASGAVLTSGPPGLSNSSAASFTFSAGEVSSFDCSLDGGGFVPCGSPATYHGLGDGAHAFSVRAQDALGNLSAPATHSWRVDTTAPETSLAAAPANGPATSVALSFAASEGGTFECRLDGAAFGLCGSPKTYGGLSLGAHRFEVRAIDTAGNADATPAVHRWTITAPVAKKVVSALLAPRAGARVARAPLLRWRPAARARYYNVQLYRGSRKVLTAWPRTTRLQLKAQWTYLGRKQKLSHGSYRWYVWPGYGAPAAQRYGALLGQSTFVVGRAARR